MKHRLVAAAFLLAAIHTQAFGQGVLPVRNGRPAVATINRDAIFLDEFVRELGPSANRTRLREGVATAEELQILDRLITIKLVVQEAARMGLDEVPEIRKQVDVASREIMREVLLERLARPVTPDPATVEKLYREAVREWKTTSLLFQDEGTAQRARKEIGSGAAFSDVAGRAVGAKTAKADSDNGYHGRKDYLPQIADAIAKLQVGQVSPVIRLQGGFAILKVVDIRYPQNAEARAEARKKAVSERQQAVLKAHDEALRRQYAVVNQAVLKSIDYEAAKPGVNALLADKRVVAEIKGAPSITVGDLTDYLRMQFYHGDDPVRQHKEMNAKKNTAFDATLSRRLLNLEAQKAGIDKSNEYRDRVRGYRESLVFDAFLQKVIVPDNKMREDEVKGYYSSHSKDYSYPQMIKVRGLAFAKRVSAENAMKKLREGADYGWMAANAEGQADKAAQGLVTLDGRPVTIDSMPAGMQKALAGSRNGEYRLYASPEGPFYVLAVQQVIAPTARPYDEVREEIAKKLYNEKLKKAVADYAGKLRAQSKVETYVKRVR